MMKGLEILCSMLGVNPEQLMTAAYEMKTLAESCDRRLAAMEEALARIERVLALEPEAPARPHGSVTPGWMVTGDRKAAGK